MPRRDARPDPVADFNTITAELKSFDPALAAKPTILVAAKIDVANPAKLKKLAAFAKRRKLPFHPISAVTGEGIEPLKYAIAELVAAHRPAAIDIDEPKPAASQTRQTQARLSAAAPGPRPRPLAACSRIHSATSLIPCESFYRLVAAPPFRTALASRSLRITYMKLRYLATVVLLALTTVAAHAQDPGTSASTSTPSPSASATPSPTPAPSPSSARTPPRRSSMASTSAATTTSSTPGQLDAGFDMRYSDLHANNAMLKNFLVGARFSGQALHPALQALRRGRRRRRHHQGPEQHRPRHQTRLRASSRGVDYSLASPRGLSRHRDRLRLAHHRQQRHHRRRRHHRHPRLQTDQLQHRPGLPLLAAASLASVCRPGPEPRSTRAGIGPRNRLGFRHRNLSAIEIC